MQKLSVKIGLDSGDVGRELEFLNRQANLFVQALSPFGGKIPSDVQRTSSAIQTMAAVTGKSAQEMTHLAGSASAVVKAGLDKEFMDAAKAIGMTDVEVKKLNADLAKTPSKGKGLAESLPGKFGGAAGIIGSIGGGIMAGMFAKSSLDVAGQMEKYQTVIANAFEGFKGVKDPLAAAKQSMAEIKQFAAATPFQVNEITGSYVKLMNRGIVPTMKEMTLFGDIAASQGKGFNQFTEAMLDAQMGEWERMKEFGIKAEQAGGRVTVNFKDFKKTIDNTPASIMAVIKEMGALKGVAGGMDKISKTWEGMISNLSDGMDAIKEQVGQFLFTFTKPFVGFFVDAEHGAGRLKIALMFLAGVVLPAVGIAAWAAWAPILIIAAPVIAALAAISAIATIVYLIFDDIFTFFKHGNNSDTYFGNLLKWMGLSYKDIMKISYAFGAFSELMGKAFSAVWGFIQPLLKVIAVIAAISIAISLWFIVLPVALIAMGTYIYAKWDEITQYFSEVGTKIKTFFIDAWESIKTAFGNAWEWMKAEGPRWAVGIVLAIAFLPVTIAALLYSGFVWAGRKIMLIDWMGIIMAVWNGIKTAVLAVWDFEMMLLDAIIGGFNAVINYDWMGLISTVGKAISNAISAAWDFGGDILKGLEAGFNALLDGKIIKNLFISGLNWVIGIINSAVPNLPGFENFRIPLLEARAAGGPVAVGHTYITGEKGPEVFTPAVSGWIHNASDTQRMIGAGQAGGAGGATGVSLSVSFGDINITANRPEEVGLSIMEQLNRALEDFQDKMNAEYMVGLPA